jgi:hypothetical protein
MTQDKVSPKVRNPTALSIELRSPQNDRTAAVLSSPGFIVTVRKIAARVKGAVMDWGATAAEERISGELIFYDRRSRGFGS